MGRKPTTGTTRNIYFGEAEEEWFIKYSDSEDINERNLIYSRHLKEPFEKMIDLILKKYVNINTKIDSFEGIKEKMYSHLGSTLNYYKPTRGTRAFSYYSNVMKHYAWQILREGNKEKNQHISFDDVASVVENDTKYSYSLTDEQQEYFDLLFEKIIKEIEKELENRNLNNKEIAVGNALLEIFHNKEFIFDNLGDSKKYDKTYIITTLRDRTDLSTKEVRDAMCRYKTLYFITKKNGVGD